MDKKTYSKIKRELLVMFYYKFKGNVYWLSSLTHILYLPENEYFSRRKEYLKFYQSKEDWNKISPESQENKIKWSMSFGAQDLQEDLDLSKMRVETIRDDPCVKAWKISGYPEQLDNTDLVPLVGREDPIEPKKKGITKVLLRSDNDWNSTSERNSWLDDYIERYQRQLRKELTGQEEPFEEKKKKRRWF